MKVEHVVALTIVILWSAGCGFLGWSLYRVFNPPPVAIVETFAMPIEHADGTVTAAKAPAEKPRTKAPSKPKGGTPVRVVEMTVKPDPDCLPIDIRLDTDRYSDGDRVSVRVDGGEILDVVDIPQAPIIAPAQRKHGIGAGLNGDGSEEVRYLRRFGDLDIYVQARALDGFGSVQTADDVMPGIGFNYWLN